MLSSPLPALSNGTRLEVLEIGAAPLMHRFVELLNLPALLSRYLPAVPGPRPDLPVATVLGVLLRHLLLARRPLYELSNWAAAFVPEYLGLQPGEAALLDDDRCGRALEHLFEADRATLLTEIVLGVIRLFELVLKQLHQDTTTVTASGEYANQPPAQEGNRPVRLCRGYNKDHRPDLKQIVYNRTVTADGGVPIHFKLHDGNTSDSSVHRETWLALKAVVGSSDFLYVADSKLCSKENMGLIAGQDGRFLTVMPRTRAEDGRFRNPVTLRAVKWTELSREENPRGKKKEPVVYEGFEDTTGSVEGYRILWYRSSQKRKHDRVARETRVAQTRKRLERLRPPGRGEGFTSEQTARAAVDRVVEKAEVGAWLHVRIVAEVHTTREQVGRGRPGPNTEHREVEHKVYRIQVEENAEALRDARECDGLFPLMTNDKGLTLAEALAKYKYQPHAEKRHEQLKSVFGVTPLWLKKPERVESLLWLYHLVELVQALIERELRQGMEEEEIANLPLYPEGRPSEAPTTELVRRQLEGKKRYRMLDGGGEVLHVFHDPLPEVGSRVLDLLGVDPSLYGVTTPTS